MLDTLQIKTRDSVIKKMSAGEYPMERNDCLCGSHNDVSIADTDRFDIPIHTVLCTHCGLLRTDPYYSEKAIAFFYEHDYRSLYTNSKAGTIDFWNEQKAFGGYVYEFVTEQLGKPFVGKKIFEIGTGAGGILATFKEKNNDVYGCDFGSDYVTFGQKMGLQHIVVGGPEALVPFGQADLVILNHTLEHFRNPLEELAKIRSLLKPEGLLYIAVPGVLSIGETYGNLKRFLQNAHVYHFSNSTLRYVLKKAGYDMVVGTELIQAIFKKGSMASTPHPAYALEIQRYLTHIRRLRWYFAWKRFSCKEAGLSLLRTSTPLYNFIRSLYRTYIKK